MCFGIRLSTDAATAITIVRAAAEEEEEEEEWAPERHNRSLAVRQTRSVGRWKGGGGGGVDPELYGGGDIKSQHKWKEEARMAQPQTCKHS